MPLVIEDAFDVEDFRVLRLQPKDVLVVRVKDDVPVEAFKKLGQQVTKILEELHGKDVVKVVVVGSEMSFDVIRMEIEKSAS